MNPIYESYRRIGNPKLSRVRLVVRELLNVADEQGGVSALLHAERFRL
jgi:hypothetical protein